MKPSIAFQEKRAVIRETALLYRTQNPRFFGSTLHGTDVDGSDLDLLVDPMPGATLFLLGGLQEALQEILGVPVNLFTDADLPEKFRSKVLAEALPI